MSLFLIRHGSTSYNAETAGAERLRGWLDIPLATAGMIAARRAARALAGRPFVKLYTSDLKRAYDTARIMSVTLAVPVEPVRDLRPWNVGSFAGQEVALVADQLAVYSNGKRSEAVKNGESFNDFLSRWRTFLKKLLRIADKTEGHIGAVTHARNLYALQEILFDDPIPVKGPPNPCAVLALDGQWGSLRLRTIHAGHQGDTFGGEGS